ncbi:hypothetical protein ACHAP5_012183 [Fusarium lateritium]
MLRPAWYYRVAALVSKRQVNSDHRWQIRPEDYDEDLSASESSNASDDESEEPECTSECGSECEHDEDGDHGDYDSVSDSSSASGASDTDHYYQMKQERKERKEELKLQRANSVYESRTPSPVHDERTINGVKRALEECRVSRNRPPLRRVSGRFFQIYCKEYEKYAPFEASPSKYIEFYGPTDDFERRHIIKRTQAGTGGHIYVHCDTIFQLDHFTPPKFPSAQVYQITGNRGRHTVDIQFVSDDLLILKISKELLIRIDEKKYPKAPPFFTFDAIAEDPTPPVEKSTVVEKSAVARSTRREEKKDRRRSASPAKSRQTSIRDFFSCLFIFDVTKTVTSTTSPTSTKTNLFTVTDTLTETVTFKTTLPSETSYAACADENFLSTANGGGAAIYVYPGAGDFNADIVNVMTSYECCIECLEDAACLMSCWQLAGGSRCTVYTTKDKESVCPNGQVLWGMIQSKANMSPQYEWSNGPCGRFRNGGKSPF